MRTAKQVLFRREDMETRAKRGRPEDLRDILAQVPDAPPLPGDEQ